MDELDVKGLKFEDLFDLEEIQSVQDVFADAAAVAAIITLPDGTPLTRPSNFCRLCNDVIRGTDKGLANCMQSDAVVGRHHPDGPVVQTCLSGGLWDGGASITVGGQHIANWLIGQVRTEAQDLEAMLAYADEIGADRERFREALAEVPEMPLERFEAISRALFLIANLLSKTAAQNLARARHIEEMKAASEQRELLERQLHHTQRMESIGRLAGGVAHDFNNLLTGILGNALLLVEDLPDEESRKRARDIVGAAQRAADLTQQLLSFSRRGPLHKDALDLHEALDEVLRLLRHSLDRRVEIRVERAARHTVVQADATQLQNALLNLTFNARDAMPEGGTLTFATRDLELDEEGARAWREGMAAGRYVELSVSDTGCGMAAEVQQHIFEPFFTTKSQGEGTGLGLASVYGCVESLRGGIRVYSRPGQGATFRLAIPAAPAEAEPSHPEAPCIVHGEGHVLVVDDEEFVRSFVSHALGRLGYEVTCCADGEEAVRHFRAHHPLVDLVLLDLVMPRMDGEQTFRLLRQIAPDIPVVVASGYAEEGRVNSLLAAGANAFLSKPFHLRDLSQIVACHIRSASV